MSIPISIFLCLLFTMITGTIAYLFFIIICKINRVTKVMKSRYVLMKAVIVSFFIPAFFIFEVIQSREDGCWTNTLFKVSPVLYNIVYIVLTIWLIGVLIHLILLLHYIHIQILSLKTYSETDEYNACLEYTKQKVGIKRRIRVYKGAYYESPCCYGVIRPGIYLPEISCTNKVIEHIFMHELLHHKNGDLLMLTIIRWLNLVYWFHPLFRKNRLLLKYRELMEDACDIDVCKRIDNYKEYIQVLIQMILRTTDQKNNVPVFLSEGFEDVMRRIDNMEKYNSQKPMKRVFVTILSVIVFSGSSLAVFAADSGVSAGYEKLYDTTWQGMEEEMNGNTENTLEEVYEIAVPDESITIETVEDDMSAYSSFYVVNYTISGNTEKRKSSSHALKAGDKVLVAVTVDPADKNVKIGFHMSNGYVRYITGSGDIYHTFTIYDDDNYTFFIQNNNSTSVEVYGHYSIK